VDRRLQLGARGPVVGKRQPRHLSENHGHLRPERLGRTHGDHLPARLRRGERRHRHQTGERHLRMEALRQRTAVRRVGPAETEHRIRSQPPHPLHQGCRHGEIHRFGDPDGRQRADGGRRQLFNLLAGQRLHRDTPHGHRDQTGHRDLRAESHRRRGRRNGLRRDFDHRPRRIRPSGRRDAAAGPELQQIPVGRRLHRPESRRDLGGQDRRQPQPRQRDGERHGGHQRQHRRHHLDRTQRQSLVLPRHRHGGLDGLPQLHVPRLHAVRSGERQRRRTARQHHLPGAEHSRGL